MDASAHREPPVWEGRPSLGYYFFLWFFVVIFVGRGVFALWAGDPGSAVIYLAGMVLLAALGLFLRRTTRYRVTRQAVSRSAGILGTTERSFPLSSIASVREQWGFFDRILGCGDVMIELKDGTQERLVGVKEPEIVCRKIAALL
jgi:uncharacterized membrane protein YdbT with pleckstrin-like domain